METREKLATLKKRAFARFKSHSYDVPSSSDFSSDPNSTNPPDNRARIEHITSIRNEQAGTSDIQGSLSFFDQNLSKPQTG